MRIVLDTASFVSSIRSGAGAASEIVRLIFARRLIALMDYKIGMEYRDVALRKEHLSASGYSRAEILKLIDLLEGASEAIEIEVRHRPLSTDPNDDMILDIAVNGRADVIVTPNKRHFSKPARRFGILVLTPAELLEMIRGEDDAD